MFEVPAPPKQAWELLIDVPRVVPCMPGATLEEAVDETSWKATVAVKLGDQLVVRPRDLLGADQTVQQLVHAARGQHELHVVHGPVGVDEPQALVQKLVTDGDARLQANHRGLTKPDLPAQLVDRVLGLLDERLLSRDLPVEVRDYGVDGVDLRDRVADLTLDRAQLILVVDLLADARVVGQACLVHRRRVARIAVDRGHVLGGLRAPRQRGDQRGEREALLHVTQILT